MTLTTFLVSCLNADSTFEEAHHYKPRPKVTRKSTKEQAQKQLSAEMTAKKPKERPHTSGGSRHGGTHNVRYCQRLHDKCIMHT